MKRFHVHIAVDDLNANIQFYSQLFGQSPAKQESDYAKWMLEEPAVNFAISSRGMSSGVDHFGMQVDSETELEGLRSNAEAASGSEVLDQGSAECCYAKSEKHWTVDPQGLAWEHFVTLSDIETFGSDVARQSGKACCASSLKGQQEVSCCD